jgi:hypothetical protein
MAAIFTRSETIDVKRDAIECRYIVAVSHAEPHPVKRIAIDNAKKIRGVFHPNPPRCKGIRK